MLVVVVAGLLKIEPQNMLLFPLSYCISDAKWVALAKCYLCSLPVRLVNRCYCNCCSGSKEPGLINCCLSSQASVLESARLKKSHGFNVLYSYSGCWCSWVNWADIINFFLFCFFLHPFFLHSHSFITSSFISKVPFHVFVQSLCCEFLRHICNNDNTGCLWQPGTTGVLAVRTVS